MATVADVIAGLVRWVGAGRAADSAGGGSAQAGRRTSVDTALVGGKVVVSDGRVITVDEDRVIAAAHRSARALAGRTGL